MSENNDLEKRLRGLHIDLNEALAREAALRAEVERLRKAAAMDELCGHPEQEAEIEKLEVEVERLRATAVEAAGLAIDHRDENERLRAALVQAVDAWESLPGGRDYSVKSIEAWLCGAMKRGIDGLRAAIGREIISNSGKVGT